MGYVPGAIAPVDRDLAAEDLDFPFQGEKGAGIQAEEVPAVPDAVLKFSIFQERYLVRLTDSAEPVSRALLQLAEKYCIGKYLQIYARRQRFL